MDKENLAILALFVGLLLLFFNVKIFLNNIVLFLILAAIAIALIKK